MALTIKQLLNYSWMSQASYLDFSGTRDIQLKLTDSSINQSNNFTDIQAQMFTDSATPADSTDGFSFVSQQPA
jgi:hypothetical protein